MVPRFFLPDLDPNGGTVALAPDEAAHAARVLRLTAGARVRVFDGRGGEWHAEVAVSTRRETVVRLLGPADAAPEPKAAITLSPAVLKGEKMDAVVRDAVMLGVAAIRPHVTARTEVALAALRRGDRAARWRRIAVASAKQCGRAVVPAVHDPVGFDELVQGPPGGVRLLLVEPTTGAPARALSEVAPAGDVELLIGPEGGWTTAEVQRLVDAGALAVRVGTRTLRADAVPIVALAALLAGWGEI